MSEAHGLSGFIAVTGATGFIGHRLCRSLCQSGYKVKALVRSPHKGEGLQALGVQVVIGDLSDADALQQLVSDSFAVVHCAGVVRGRKLDDFYDTNVASVERLLSSAEHHNPDIRILFLSSLAARQPDLSHYSKSKYLGELAAVERETAVAFSIVRPPAVYGPGDRELLPLFRLMKKGLALVPGRPSDRVSLIYVDDLVGAVNAWLSSPDVPRQIFTLCDGVEGGYSWAEIVDIAAESFKRRVRVVQIPRFLLNGIAAINLGVSRLLSYAPMLTPEKVRELRHPDWCCDHRDFSAVTGWQPKVTFSEGLRLTFAGDFGAPNVR